MGWGEDFMNAVSSGVAAVGDAVEGIVETVTTTAQNAVDSTAQAVEDTVNAGVDWVSKNVKVGSDGIINLNGLAMLIGGVINAVATTVREVVDGVLHIVTAAGKIVGSILRLDLPGLIQALTDLLIGVAEIILSVVRLITLGTIIGKIFESYERNELRNFVEKRLSNAFSGTRLDSIREKLNLNGTVWGLTCSIKHSTFVMDSRTFPLATLHNNGTLNLYLMAGVLSNDPLNLRAMRFTVKFIDDRGSESTLPATRYHISKFLETGKPNLKIYALDGVELNDSMKFADRHFKTACIHFKWNQRIFLPRQYQPVTFNLTNAPEYRMTIDFCDTSVSPTVQKPGISAFLNRSGMKPAGEGELTIRAQCSFKLEDGSSANSQLNGFTSGRDIDEALNGDPCTSAPSIGCIVNKQSILSGENVGSGVTTRNVFPAYFSKIVLAHELGHYFGLCHFNHPGPNNIMLSLSAGGSILDPGLFDYYLNSEAHFNLNDKKNMWRFIIDKLGDEL